LDKMKSVWPSQAFMRSSMIAPSQQFLGSAHRVEQVSTYVPLQYAGHESHDFLFAPFMLQHHNPGVFELQLGQLGADLPEAFGRGVIVGHLRRTYCLLLDEIFPTDTLDRRGTGQVDDRLGTLLRANSSKLQDAEEDCCKATVVPAKIRRHKARVQGVRYNTRPCQPSRQLIGKQNVSEFRARIGAPTSIPVLPLQVGKVQSGVAVCLRRDVDNAGGVGGFQGIKEEVSEQEVGEMVESKGHLKAVLAELSPGEQRSSIIDQDIQVRATMLNLPG
jgi:hypothetical protein